MPFIYLILFALGIAAFGAAIIGLVVSAARMRGSKRPYPMRLWLPAIAGTLPLLLLTGLVFAPSIFQNSRQPSAHFKDVFGAAPGAEIRNLQSEVESGPDFGLIYLAYDRSDEAWSATVRRAGNPSEAPSSAFVESITDGDVPDWWKHGFDRKCQRLEARHAHGWDDIAIIDCKDNNRIYVLASNID